MEVDILVLKNLYYVNLVLGKGGLLHGGWALAECVPTFLLHLLN